MHGPTCIFWANLTPFSLQGKRDVKAACFIRCYYAAVLGPRANESYELEGGIAVEELVATWGKAFASCPAVPINDKD